MSSSSKSLDDDDEAIDDYRKWNDRTALLDSIRLKLRHGWRNNPPILQQYFQSCYANWKLYKGPRTPKQILRLQALYKQATQGDNTSPAPRDLSSSSGQKWTEYKKLHGMSSEMAKRRFITLLAEIDPLLIDVMPEERPPPGFPLSRHGIVICAKCNTVAGCLRPLLDEFKVNLEQQLMETESLHGGDINELKRWIRHALSVQRCVWGVHQPINSFQAKPFMEWFQRPENGGFMPYDSSTIVGMLWGLVQSRHDYTYDLMINRKIALEKAEEAKKKREIASRIRQDRRYKRFLKEQEKKKLEEESPLKAKYLIYNQQKKMKKTLSTVNSIIEENENDEENLDENDSEDDEIAEEDANDDAATRAAVYNTQVICCQRLKEVYEQLSGSEFCYERWCERDHPACNERRTLERGANHKHEAILDPPTQIDKDTFEMAISLRQECQKLGINPSTGVVKDIKQRCEIYRKRIEEFHKTRQLAIEAKQRNEERTEVHRHEKDLVMNMSKEMLQRQVREACDSGNVSHLFRILNRGGDVNEETIRGQTPLLTLVVHEESSEVMEKLLTKWSTVEVDRLNCMGLTALMLACRLKDQKTIHVLMKHGASVTTVDIQFGWSALHHCIIHSSDEAVRILTEYVKESVGDLQRMVRFLDRKDREGNTPLLLAARKRNGLMCHLLISLGASTITRNHHGQSPASEARGCGHKVLADWLEKKITTGVTRVETYSDVQFEKQSRYAQYKIREHLQEFGSLWLTMIHGKVSQHPIGCPTVSHCQRQEKGDIGWELQQRFMDTLFLCLMGISPELYGREAVCHIHGGAASAASSVLLSAVSGGPEEAKHLEQSAETLKKLSALLNEMVTLVQQGYTYPNYECPPQPLAWTPLMCAVALQDIRAIRLLVREFAAVDYPNRQGTTALMLAAQLNFTEVISVLLELGASLDVMDNAGYTTLGYATSLPKPSVMSTSLVDVLLGETQTMSGTKLLSSEDLLRHAMRLQKDAMPAIPNGSALENGTGKSISKPNPQVLFGGLRELVIANRRDASPEIIARHRAKLQLLARFGLSAAASEQHIMFALRSLQWRVPDTQENDPVEEEDDTKEDEEEHSPEPFRVLRCPICTLPVPCAHFFAVSSLIRYMNQRKKAAARAAIVAAADAAIAVASFKASDDSSTNDNSNGDSTAVGDESDTFKSALSFVQEMRTRRRREELDRRGRVLSETVLDNRQTNRREELLAAYQARERQVTTAWKAVQKARREQMQAENLKAVKEAEKLGDWVEEGVAEDLFDIPNDDNDNDSLVVGNNRESPLEESSIQPLAPDLEQHTVSSANDPIELATQVAESLNNTDIQSHTEFPSKTAADALAETEEALQHVTVEDDDQDEDEETSPNLRAGTPLPLSFHSILKPTSRCGSSLSSAQISSRSSRRVRFSLPSEENKESESEIMTDDIHPIETESPAPQSPPGDDFTQASLDATIETTESIDAPTVPEKSSHASWPSLSAIESIITLPVLRHKEPTMQSTPDFVPLPDVPLDDVPLADVPLADIPSDVITTTTSLQQPSTNVSNDLANPSSALSLISAITTPTPRDSISATILPLGEVSKLVSRPGTGNSRLSSATHEPFGRRADALTPFRSHKTSSSEVPLSLKITLSGWIFVHTATLHAGITPLSAVSISTQAYAALLSALEHSVDEIWPEQYCLTSVVMPLADQLNASRCVLCGLGFARRWTAMQRFESDASAFTSAATRELANHHQKQRQRHPSTTSDKLHDPGATRDILLGVISGMTLGRPKEDEGNLPSESIREGPESVGSIEDITEDPDDDSSLSSYLCLQCMTRRELYERVYRALPRPIRPSFDVSWPLLASNDNNDNIQDMGSSTSDVTDPTIRSAQPVITSLEQPLGQALLRVASAEPSQRLKKWPAKSSAQSQPVNGLITSSSMQSLHTDSLVEHSPIRPTPSLMSLLQSPADADSQLSDPPSVSSVSMRDFADEHVSVASFLTHARPGNRSRELAYARLLIARGHIDEAERSLRGIMGRPHVNDELGLPLLLEALTLLSDIHRSLGLWPLVLATALDIADLTAELLGVGDKVTCEARGAVAATWLRMRRPQSAEMYIRSCLEDIDSTMVASTKLDYCSRLDAVYKHVQQDFLTRHSFWQTFIYPVAQELRLLPGSAFKISLFNSVGIGGFYGLLSAISGPLFVCRRDFFRYCQAKATDELTFPEQEAHSARHRLPDVNRRETSRTKSIPTTPNSDLPSELAPLDDTALAIYARFMELYLRAHVIADAEIASHIIHEIATKFLPRRLIGKSHLASAFYEVTSPTCIAFFDAYLRQETRDALPLKTFDDLFMCGLLTLRSCYERFLLYESSGSLLRKTSPGLVQLALDGAALRLQCWLRQKNAIRRTAALRAVRDAEIRSSMNSYSKRLFGRSL